MDSFHERRNKMGFEDDLTEEEKKSKEVIDNLMKKKNLTSKESSDVLIHGNILIKGFMKIAEKIKKEREEREKK